MELQPARLRQEDNINYRILYVFLWFYKLVKSASTIYTAIAMPLSFVLFRAEKGKHLPPILLGVLISFTFCFTKFPIHQASTIYTAIAMPLSFVLFRAEKGKHLPPILLGVLISFTFCFTKFPIHHTFQFFLISLIILYPAMGGMMILDYYIKLLLKKFKREKRE